MSNVAQPLAEAVQQPIQAVINLIFKNMSDGIIANKNFSMVQLLVLEKFEYKVIRDAKCAPHVNLVLAATKSTGVDAVTRDARVNRRIGGHKAGCFIPKTAVDINASYNS